MVAARKTSRLVEQLHQATRNPSPKTDGEASVNSAMSRRRWRRHKRFIARLPEKAPDERGRIRRPLRCEHFQLAMRAYNLTCRLMLFNREPQADTTPAAQE